MAYVIYGDRFVVAVPSLKLIEYLDNKKLLIKQIVATEKVIINEMNFFLQCASFEQI